MALDDDIERVLWTDEQISKRVTELAGQITRDFSGESLSESSPVVVGVATGAFLFLADLVRKIKLPVTVDFIRAESYGSGTVSNGAPRISFDLKVGIQGKHVILVEDIVDTGNTLSCLIAHLESRGASSVSVCTLFDKPARRKCPDYFIVGYGLDFAELYRNLPYVGILKPEIYN
ncbi:hypothetical protein RJ640_021952 [Escallonia rubra]|uniref:Hypoxanthine phosphoribosyltransferase n=1 Tax=Escallonia rubra TaxID=112253 RepID=A0AA88RCI0_9ASTE|nr:hypothetical protein RJ640_021952 [Escallonia rubra]